MDADKVIQDLNRRFSAPLPEFYNRRIIFWYDEEQEFLDKIDDIVIDNVKFVALTGSNKFYVKKLLSFDDKYSNYLVYCPLSYEDIEDNWLLDIELYSEEFRADLISMWLDEMKISSTPAMRNLAKYYKKYFNAKDRRAKIASQNNTISTSSQMHLAVMSAICGEKKIKPNNIVRCVLKAGLDMENNSVYKDLVNYGADNAFWALIAQRYGYIEAEHDLGRLATHILLTACTRTMRFENLAGLNSFISQPHQAYCYDLVSEWLYSNEIENFYEISRYVENETRLSQRFNKLNVNDLVDTEIFPCINEVILTKIMTEISNHIIDVDTIIQVVEKRRTCIWYNLVENFYDGILQVAHMQNFYKEYSAGFHIVDAKDLWEEYTKEYYKMDIYYRLFHIAFQKSLEISNILLDDLFKQVVDIVEGLYTHWFLANIGENWSNVCAEQFEKYGKILDVPQQTDFYNSKVATAENRVFVVISDAMRYEVATTLAEQLKRETQSIVEIESMQSIFPSITKFGMAALLPHDKLTAEIKSTTRTERLSVLADGMSTESNNREKVLKQTNELSVALQYKYIIGLKRAERQALVKGKEVVYIYHDTIDEASHNSDTAVFLACDRTISELKNLIRIITNDFGGSHVILTSDHGFLYTYSPLNEDSKVSASSFNNQDIEYGRRYAVMQKNSHPEYLIPVKFLDGNTEFEGYAPRESIRIKMSGGGLNFVHGGISLQEMVVPVIQYRHLRNSSVEYKKNKDKYDTKPVSINLLSANRKICNMIFSLNFYQNEPVGDTREVANYSIYFVDSNGKKISDIQKIIADKTSDNAQERTFRCSFNLKSLQYKNTDVYYLVIEDETGLQLPQKEEFQIDIAFAVDDFNFFD